MNTQSTTLTVRVPIKLKQDLAELSKLTNRSQSALAAHAIKAYVKHELDICRKLQEGLESIERGDMLSTEEVMEKAQKIIDGYAKRQVG